MMWRFFAVGLFCATLSGQLSGQADAQFNPKAGFAIYKYQDEQDPQGGMSHPGFQVGFDAYLRKDRLTFIPGFHYARHGIRPEGFSLGDLFNSRDYLHYVRMPLSAGYLLKVGSIGEVTPLVGLDLNFFLSVDDNDAQISNSDLKSFQAGAHLGTQVRLTDYITLDVRYETSLTPSFKNRSKSKTSGFLFALGFVI